MTSTSEICGSSLLCQSPFRDLWFLFSGDLGPGPCVRASVHMSCARTVSWGTVGASEAADAQRASSGTQASPSIDARWEGARTW